VVLLLQRSGLGIVCLGLENASKESHGHLSVTIGFNITIAACPSHSLSGPFRLFSLNAVFIFTLSCRQVMSLKHSFFHTSLFVPLYCLLISHEKRSPKNSPKNPKISFAKGRRLGVIFGSRVFPLPTLSRLSRFILISS
jgi:hypothetical protein